MKIILHWIIISVAVFLTSSIVPGIIISPLWTVLIVGAWITLFNLFIKPIITILTLPINILTFGIFSLILNGLIFWFLGSIIKGFSVTTFTAAFFGAIIVSVISWMIRKAFQI